MARGDRNLGWPGFFRLFTVLCAVVLLLAQGGQELAGVSAGDRQVLEVYEGLTCWTVPALFMLWGMFALEGGKPRASACLLGLALPAFCLLVFWGAVYAAVSYLLAGGTLTPAGVWAALASAAKGNTYFHLWVLYPLIGLYLVHPVLHRFTASAGRGEVRYFLGLCFLFANLLPLWSAFFPDSVVAAQLERLGVHLALGWAGCYVGGWYLRHYTIGRVPEFLLYGLGALGLVLTLMGPRLIGGTRELWQQYTAPNVVLTAAALCALFRYVLGVSEERSRRQRVSGVAKISFGIYLVHVFFLILLRHFGITALSFVPALSVPVLSAAVFLGSFTVAWPLSKLPLAGKYLT